MDINCSQQCLKMMYIRPALNFQNSTVTILPVHVNLKKNGHNKCSCDPNSFTQIVHLMLQGCYFHAHFKFRDRDAPSISQKIVLPANQQLNMPRLFPEKVVLSKYVFYIHLSSCSALFWVSACAFHVLFSIQMCYILVVLLLGPKTRPGNRKISLGSQRPSIEIPAGERIFFPSLYH